MRRLTFPCFPGGYKFSDFFRVGALLNVMLGIVAIILIPIFWPF